MGAFYIPPTKRELVAWLKDRQDAIKLSAVQLRSMEKKQLLAIYCQYRRKNG